MAMSARNQEGNLVIIDTFELPEIKTKDFIGIMKNFQFDNCLVITSDIEDKIALSSRNAVGYKVLPVAGLNVYDILKYSKLMLIQSSLAKIEERLMV
jgi:large subunit ribosomal protein L4